MISDRPKINKIAMFNKLKLSLMDFIAEILSIPFTILIESVKFMTAVFSITMIAFQIELRHPLHVFF